MPQVILIELIYHVVLWLNAFPTKTGMSAMLLPREIVYRHKLDFAKHCKAQFGTYCKAHNDPVLTNMMVTWSTPTIILSPTGNLQGTYKFFSLTKDDSISHGQLGHQEGGAVWQGQRHLECCQFLGQEWSPIQVE
jgi:hypothetical protein